MSSAFRISIGVNIVLAGAVAALLWRDRAPAPASSPSAATDRPVVVQTVAPKTAATVQAVAPNPDGSGLNPTAVAQLERMGVSRDTLIAVVIERLNQRATKREVELQKKYAPKVVPDKELREFARQCDTDRIAALKEAFGEEGYHAWDKEQTLRELNSARPPGDALQMTADEAEQAYRLQKDFDEKAKVMQRMVEDGSADRADIGTLQAQAQQALNDQLEKLLGKERYAELRGDADPTTQVYRDYGDLNPTPTQAKAVLQADAAYHDQQAALSRQLGANAAGAADVAAQLKAIQDAHDQSLRDIFGAEAYDQMKQQSDPTYRSLKQYAGTWELDDQQVQSVYASLHAFQDQADRMRNAAEMSQTAGQPVNWQAVNAAIEQARQQTEASLQTQIGNERLYRLEQNGLLPKG